MGQTPWFARDALVPLLLWTQAGLSGTGPGGQPYWQRLPRTVFQSGGMPGALTMHRVFIWKP